MRKRPLPADRPSVLGVAHVMIGQRPDDIAVADMVACAAGSDAFEFAFEPFQLLDTSADRFQLFHSNAIRPVARAFRMCAEIEKLPDGFDRQAQVSGVLDEGQTFTPLPVITSLVTFGALGGLQ